MVQSIFPKVANLKLDQRDGTCLYWQMEKNMKQFLLGVRCFSVIILVGRFCVGERGGGFRVRKSIFLLSH